MPVFSINQSANFVQDSFKNRVKTVNIVQFKAATLIFIADYSDNYFQDELIYYLAYKMSKKLIPAGRPDGTEQICLIFYGEIKRGESHFDSFW